MEDGWEKFLFAICLIYSDDYNKILYWIAYKQQKFNSDISEGWED